MRRIGRSIAAAALAGVLLGWPVGLGSAGLSLPGAPSLLAGLPLPALGPATALAATPDLTLTTDARYVVQPDRGRVHVVVDITAANGKADTATRTYYFDSAYLAVLPGTRAFTISSPGVHPTVRVASAGRDYTLLSIGLGQRLTSGQSQRLRLQFDLPDPGGAPTRPVRIGPSLVSFPVWAFATDGTPGSSVTLVFPAGYAVTAQAGTLPEATTASDGSIVYRTGPLARPLAWYAYVTADRPATLVASTVDTTVGTTPVVVGLERWADDPAWARRVGEVFRDGLPRLSSAIGLPYPDGSSLTVRESTSRTTGGYAGLFDASTHTVEVAYYADPFVSLHEAAHVWFNGTLLADRWANEGFASYYAGSVAHGLDITPRAPGLTPAETAAAQPLNAWGGVGAEQSDVEDYGYAASYRLASLIADRAGADTLRSVWAAAAAREAPYQPVRAGAGPVESLDAPPDWRNLLDLLEQRSGTSFEDLWSAWVVRPTDAALLGARAAARAHYAATMAAAGDWELPSAVRRAMDAWQFDQAVQLLDQADEALTAWARLRSLAGANGLTPPESVRQAFEGSRGPAAALDEIRAETDAIARIAAAETEAGRQRGIFETIGLLGETPAERVAAARSAYAVGDLGAVEEATSAALATWAGADDLGRRRAAVTLFAVLVVGGTLVVVASAFRRRRHEPLSALGRRRFATQARPVGAPAPGAGYATLRREPFADDPRESSGGQPLDERGGTSDVTAGSDLPDRERSD